MSAYGFFYGFTREETETRVRYATGLGKKIAEALHAAHEQGVIHRDVKPANIMIVKRDGREEPILTDFGLAKRVPKESIGLTKTGDILGTPLYMSPEQVMGEEADRRADVWALGVMLYEFTTGQTPFPAKTVPEIIYSIRVDQPQLPQEINPYIPTSLQNIILKSLQKDLNKRYQTAAELERDLDLFEKGQPLPEHQAYVPEEKISRRALLLGGGATVVAGGMGWLWYLFSDQEETIDTRDIAQGTGSVNTPLPVEEQKKLTYNLEKLVDLPVTRIPQDNNNGPPAFIYHEPVNYEECAVFLQNQYKKRRERAWVLVPRVKSEHEGKEVESIPIKKTDHVPFTIQGRPIKRFGNEIYYTRKGAVVEYSGTSTGFTDAFPHSLKMLLNAGFPESILYDPVIGFTSPSAKNYKRDLESALQEKGYNVDVRLPTKDEWERAAQTGMLKALPVGGREYVSLGKNALGIIGYNEQGQIQCDPIPNKGFQGKTSLRLVIEPRPE